MTILILWFLDKVRGTYTTFAGIVHSILCSSVVSHWWHQWLSATNILFFIKLFTWIQNGEWNGLD